MDVSHFSFSDSPSRSVYSISIDTGALRPVIWSWWINNMVNIEILTCVPSPSFANAKRKDVSVFVWAPRSRDVQIEMNWYAFVRLVRAMNCNDCNFEWSPSPPIILISSPSFACLPGKFKRSRCFWDGCVSKCVLVLTLSNLNVPNGFKGMVANDRGSIGIGKLERNSKQQSTGYQSGTITNLDCVSLSGGFRRRLRNQNFTGRPKAMQSQYDSTINPREERINQSTINLWNRKVRNSSIASDRNEMKIS